jgi:hypothetical protein
MGRRKTQKADDELPSYEWNTDMNLSLVPYWFLAFVRVAITLLPQNGYIHPDEYFQSVEIVAGVSSQHIERLMKVFKYLYFLSEIYFIQNFNNQNDGDVFKCTVVYLSEEL